MTLVQGKRRKAKKKKKERGEVEEDRVNSKEILIYTKKSNPKMNLIKVCGY